MKNNYTNIGITWGVLILLIGLSMACSGDRETSKTPRAERQSAQIKPQPEPRIKLQPDQTAKTDDQTTSDINSDVKTAVVNFQAYDIDGNLHRSDEWIGKQPTIINVWGTWCPPCRRELPDLIRLYNEYKDKGIALVGISVRDTPEKVKKFAGINKMEWPLLIGKNEHLYALGVTTGIPTTIFYDRNGKEVQRFVGPRSYMVFKEAFESIW